VTGSPKVRDFTASDRALEVAVETAPIYELLLSLFVWGSKSDSNEYEYGSSFFEQLEVDIPENLTAEMAEMVGCGELWLSLIGLAHETDGITTAPHLLRHLESMDPIALRRVLIDGTCSRTDITDERAAAAAAGDPAAIAAVVKSQHIDTGFQSLLESDAEETRRRVIAMLAGVNAALEASISDSMPALRRDADEKRSLAGSMDPQQLVETATNGVTFEPQPHIESIVLIPSKIIRPWTVIIEHMGLRIFAYSVSDEHLQADPDAPPSYLVDLYKALGDERRLRILAMLAEGDHGLMEIAERIDLAKSTAHHHLRILRSAGLVRVTVGAKKDYSLRRHRVPEAARLLDAYLTTPAEAAESVPVTETKRS
jgi:DNA-binding transcriptional ArsR family regulator